LTKRTCGSWRRPERLRNGYLIQSLIGASRRDAARLVERNSLTCFGKICISLERKLSSISKWVESGKHPVLFYITQMCIILQGVQVTP
jgi:hypothetical protein